MRVRPVWGIAMAAALAACSMDDGGCTAIGCDSGVFFDLHTLVAQGQPGTATICVDGKCLESPLAQGGWYPIVVDGSEGPKQPAHITATFKSDDSSIMVSLDQRDVVFTKNAPNGEKCGPICWGAGWGWDSTTKTLVAGAQGR